jgi:hypothetical protein
MLSPLSFDFCLTFLHLCIPDSFFKLDSSNSTINSSYSCKSNHYWDQIIFTFFLLFPYQTCSLLPHLRYDMSLIWAFATKHIQILNKLTSPLIVLSSNYLNPLGPYMHFHIYLSVVLKQNGSFVRLTSLCFIFFFHSNGHPS